MEGFSYMYSREDDESAVRESRPTFVLLKLREADEMKRSRESGGVMASFGFLADAKTRAPARLLPPSRSETERGISQHPTAGVLRSFEHEVARDMTRVRYGTSRLRPPQPSALHDFHLWLIMQRFSGGYGAGHSIFRIRNDMCSRSQLVYKNKVRIRGRLSCTTYNNNNNTLNINPQALDLSSQAYDSAKHHLTTTNTSEALLITVSIPTSLQMATIHPTSAVAAATAPIANAKSALTESMREARKQFQRPYATAKLQPHRVAWGIYAPRFARSASFYVPALICMFGWPFAMKYAIDSYNGVHDAPVKKARRS
ncbi:hypothetical protein CERZMDRAFT_96638 [Cercospora zeae-maydis SCOH1-5]|uniref:Uncharacterized protein n=1 Tax=Cercospora zeae-maydis SCOH1-5 TaxID=717836 RepID=A0A6A6FI58_9PEZI|nr:hypothetical protein CERZMDRAFT_96638 [Cercospora zeae-maydis SCOH1-5]